MERQPDCTNYREYLLKAVMTGASRSTINFRMN